MALVGGYTSSEGEDEGASGAGEATKAAPSVAAAASSQAARAAPEVEEEDDEDESEEEDSDDEPAAKKKKTASGPGRPNLSAIPAAGGGSLALVPPQVRSKGRVVSVNTDSISDRTWQQESNAKK
eukprot:gnl/TRDRNA2_/TRDRNA2_194532_c0_seq1.p1 gnl/TRDRNA2_/TRDRNA2_194532_c0~~gnl/TRDRNA2_/TRDRNA2_194532_c0_seq1.p1  ORF type:complete len:125 (+),score=40.02 gnl/TRDRNA2_/TRDRNA2_194532_c0_seq1:84-458(+)